MMLRRRSECAGDMVAISHCSCIEGSFSSLWVEGWLRKGLGRCWSDSWIRFEGAWGRGRGARRRRSERAMEVRRRMRKMEEHFCGIAAAAAATVRAAMRVVVRCDPCSEVESSVPDGERWMTI